MSEGTAHVVGAGLAGLSAALRLASAGRRVILHEAQPHAGGRCRSFHDPRLDREIDNGNHLVLSGNRAVRDYLRLVGAGDRLVAAPARYAFADLATGARWTLAPNAGPLPWWIAAPGRRVPGTSARDYLSVLALMRAGAGATVAEAVTDRGPLWTRFWEPMTLAVLNTVPERASARLLARVIGETFLRGAGAARPMLAPRGLGHALVAPALAALAGAGAEIRHGRSLRAITSEDGRATALRFSDGPEALGPGDSAILALPAWRLSPVLPDLRLPEGTGAILNAFFRVPEAMARRLEGHPPILGTLSATTQWIFRRGDVVSITVSASDALGLDGVAGEDVIPRLWAETCAALGFPDGTAYLGARVNKERRATFDQSPAGAARRPGPRTPLDNLFLAGDATDTGLPATIEGAVRSGETAARLAA